MAPDFNLPLDVEDIIVAEGRREVNGAAVNKLAASIKEIGLKHPITVRERDGKYYLVAGLHRLEAFKKLGKQHIPATISKMSKVDARLWEIAENLHRADLTKLERDEHVAEWIRLTEQVSSQSATKPQGGRPESGVNAAARELGVDKDDAHRAVKVAAISEPAKSALREAGLDDKRGAMLTVAREKTPEAQIAKVHELKLPKSDDEVVNDQYNALVGAWNRASPEARERFRDYLDAPEFLRRA
jgi:uncharacterized ParB-like nuclease family protein